MAQHDAHQAHDGTDNAHPIVADPRGAESRRAGLGTAGPSGTADCPVMPGTPVDKAQAEEEGLVRDYQGTRYYLCCDACAPMWDAGPARYATT